MHSGSEVVALKVVFQKFEIGHSSEQATQEGVTSPNERNDAIVAQHQEQIHEESTKALFKVESAARRMPSDVYTGDPFERLSILMQLKDDPGEDAGEQFDVVKTQFDESVRRIRRSIKKQGNDGEKGKGTSVFLKEASSHMELCRDGFEEIGAIKREEAEEALAA